MFQTLSPFLPCPINFYFNWNIGFLFCEHHGKTIASFSRIILIG